MMFPRAVTILAMLLVPATQAQEPPNPPAYCINHDGNPAEPNVPPHACMCHQECVPIEGERQGGEDPMCKVYCQKDHCHCVADCPDS